MECNKDEAVKAKEVAEKKLLDKDIPGAKKFALKAQNLFPKLDGLSQFLEIIDVYVAHEKKINGEADYYGILGVDPLANEEVLKKQYKRMALSLHPDKNKSVGADGAFKILSQAWSVISDIVQRTVYNSKLNIRALNQTAGTSVSSSAMYTTTAANPHCVPTRPRTQGTSTSSAYVPNHPKTPATATDTEFIPIPSRNPHPIPGYQQTPAGATPARFIPAPRPPFHHQYAPYINHPTFSTPPSRPETFWTTCGRCMMHYEYRRIYLNQNLLCRRCQQPFLATEMPAPKVNNHSSSRSWCFPRQQKHMFGGSSGTVVSQAAPFQPSDERLKETVNMTRDNHAPMKNSSIIPEEMKAASASNAVSVLNGEKPAKKRRTNSQKHDSAGDETSGRRSGVKRASAKLNGNFGAKRESRSVKELSHSEIRVMLVRKANTGILGLLNEWEAEESKKSSHMKTLEVKDSVNHVKTEKSKDGLFRDPKNILQPKKSSSLEETDDIDANADETVSMMVPDANFHNFDEDRIELSFSENQVWAAYDDDDGMPRYYALVHYVISRNPFKMQISWLNSKSSSEFGSLDWIGSGFTKTSGDYKVGKCEVSKRLNSFSHPVKWKKGPRGAIQVFPTKGDVWAVYRNWSPDWVDQNPTDETIHKYDVVVVLEGFNEDVGVVVAPLVKVAGFTSVFNLDRRGTRTTPKENMFRFSHQVPFYILNGLEAENSPKGCYELDPAALHLELLKVITDAEAAEERVSQHPVMLNDSEARVESTSAGKTHALQKERGFEGGKNILTYSRRKKKGRKIERDVDDLQI